jgi:hypothetical protein
MLVFVALGVRHGHDDAGHGEIQSLPPAHPIMTSLIRMG